MIENEIYCYINSFLKWNTSKETRYIVGNKKFFGKSCILNSRNKSKSEQKVLKVLKVNKDHKGNGQDYN